MREKRGDTDSDNMQHSRNQVMQAQVTPEERRGGEGNLKFVVTALFVLSLKNSLLYTAPGGGTDGYLSGTYRNSF